MSDFNTPSPYLNTEDSSQTNQNKTHFSPPRSPSPSPLPYSNFVSSPVIDPRSISLDRRSALSVISKSRSNSNEGFLPIFDNHQERNEEGRGIKTHRPSLSTHFSNLSPKIQLSPSVSPLSSPYPILSFPSPNPSLHLIPPEEENPTIHGFSLEGRDTTGHSWREERKSEERDREREIRRHEDLYRSEKVFRNLIQTDEAMSPQPHFHRKSQRATTFHLPRSCEGLGLLGEELKERSILDIYCTRSAKKGRSTALTTSLIDSQEGGKERDEESQHMSVIQVMEGARSPSHLGSSYADDGEIETSPSLLPITPPPPIPPPRNLLSTGDHASIHALASSFYTCNRSTRSVICPLSDSDGVATSVEAPMREEEGEKKKASRSRRSKKNLSASVISPRREQGGGEKREERKERRGEKSLRREATQVENKGEEKSATHLTQCLSPSRSEPVLPYSSRKSKQTKCSSTKDAIASKLFNALLFLLPVFIVNHYKRFFLERESKGRFRRGRKKGFFSYLSLLLSLLLSPLELIFSPLKNDFSEVIISPISELYKEEQLQAPTPSRVRRNSQILPLRRRATEGGEGRERASSTVMSERTYQNLIQKERDRREEKRSTEKRRHEKGRRVLKNGRSLFSPREIIKSREKDLAKEQEQIERRETREIEERGEREGDINVTHEEILLSLYEAERSKEHTSYYLKRFLDQWRAIALSLLLTLFLLWKYRPFLFLISSLCLSIFLFFFGIFYLQISWMHKIDAFKPLVSERQIRLIQLNDKQK